MGPEICVPNSSFSRRQMAAVKQKNKQIKQLQLVNYHEDKADRTLLQFIAAKYINK
jgi:hypothetical protein